MIILLKTSNPVASTVHLSLGSDSYLVTSDKKSRFNSNFYRLSLQVKDIMLTGTHIMTGQLENRLGFGVFFQNIRVWKIWMSA